jgi:hypothetical protein
MTEDDDYKRGYADGYAKAEAEFIELKALYAKHLASLQDMHVELRRVSRLIWDHHEQDDVKQRLQ